MQLQFVDGAFSLTESTHLNLALTAKSPGTKDLGANGLVTWIRVQRDPPILIRKMARGLEGIL